MRLRRAAISGVAAALAMAALAALPVTMVPTARADGCYICTRGSGCGDYCRYSGRDSWEKRKACRNAGCRIGGTRSCPTAANVRICAGATGSLAPDLTPELAIRPRPAARR